MLLEVKNAWSNICTELIEINHVDNIALIFQHLIVLETHIYTISAQLVIFNFFFLTKVIIKQ